MRKLARGIALLAALTLLALPAAGCQPNPTTPPVVNKNDLENKIKDKTAAPSASAPAETEGTADATATPAEPQKQQAHYASGKLIVDIDAAIVQPSAGKLPVVKVSPRKFTQAEVDNIIRVLFQGKPAYKVKEKMTKSEIEEQLIEIKAMKSQAKEGDKSLEKINYLIEHLEEELKTAPEVIEPELHDGKLKTDDLGGQEINVRTPLGKRNDANLFAYNSKSGRTSSLWFTNEEQGESYLGTESALTGTPRGVTMTLDDAKALAEQTVQDLGADLKLASISIGTCRGVSGKYGSADPNGSQAYLFAFTREVNGVTTTYDTEIGGSLPQEEIDRMDRNGKGEYIEPHPYERIVMAVDDTGILEFQWTSPNTVGETVSDNVETMPFDQIMGTFEKQFFIHNALKNKSEKTPETGKNGETETSPELPADYAEGLRAIGIYNSDSIGYGDDVKTCSYRIDRIVLGLTRIAVKDKENEFMIVPVYDFFGSITVEYNAESGYAGFTAEITNHSFLTINAIDGSIINRSYGY